MTWYVIKTRPNRVPDGIITDSH